MKIVKKLFINKVKTPIGKIFKNNRKFINSTSTIDNNIFQVSEHSKPLPSYELYNQTESTMIEEFPKNHHPGSCICLFLLLTFYYL